MRGIVFLCLVLLTTLLNGCANFRRLSGDLKIIDEEYRIYGVIRNADAQKTPVYAGVVEWHPGDKRVYSGDRIELPPGGAFAFSVKSPLHQHVMAFADRNRNGIYDAGELVWINRDSNGKPTSVKLDGAHRFARVDGKLAPGTVPDDLRDAMVAFLGGRTVHEVVTHRGVRLSVGEEARLDDPRFAATRGEDGLWTPATMAITSGFGIYFLEPYDPRRAPVLFIHGAAGSPQDWRYAMERLDRTRYQAWFAFYPSGGRLDASAQLLNEGVRLLHSRYEFRRLHVVAHSMGGLVARRFIQRNVLEDRQDYIRTFITFSSPWNGHEAAAAGVKWAPSVVPSWRDMEHGSDFLGHLFDRRLKGKVEHHLFYSHHGSRSLTLPPENDGTVSVASQLRPEAKDDAASIQGYDEDHVSILSSTAALTRGKAILDASPP